MPSQVEPLCGQAFDHILAELYTQTFPGVPGQSDPFTLPVLLREYVAFALAVYFHCEECQTHHRDAIGAELKMREASQGTGGAHQAALHWSWEPAMLDILLYTRIELRNLCEEEWTRWKRDWSVFVDKLGPNARVAHLVAFAIAAARDDKLLLMHEEQAIRVLYPDYEVLQGVLRDIVRVVGFMTAATSIYRVTPEFGRILAERQEELQAVA